MSTLHDEHLSDEELEAIALSSDGIDPWADYTPTDAPEPPPENTLDPEEFAAGIAAMTAQEEPDLGEIPESLTDDQRHVVESLTGHLVVVAGPGAGKTRTLVERVVNTIRHGARPDDLLVVTFTRKAAGEVRERLAESLGENRSRQINVTTFHGFSGQILRSEGHRIGLKPTYEVLSGSEQKTLVKNLVKQYKLATDPDYLRLLSGAKRNPELTSTSARARHLAAHNQPDAAQLIVAYEKEKRRLDRLDYDDLILIAHHLLQMDEVRAHWGTKYQHVQVDEYQDTDGMQHAIVKAVATGAQSLMTVGDLDQSIYAWRGASPELFANFRSDYPDARVLYLNDNFRSTPEILDVVRHTIDPIDVPYRSELRPNNQQGAAPAVEVAQDQMDEATAVVNWIKDLLGKQTKFSEIAVLYRGRRQNLQLQAALNKERIPVKLSGSVGFYEKKTVKDLLAWFRLAVKPDEMSFRRVIDQSPGLGPKAAQDLLDAAETERGGDIVGYLSAHVNDMIAIGKGTQKKVEAMKQVVDNIAGLRRVMDSGGITEGLLYALSCVPGEVLVKDEVSEGDLDDIREILVADAVDFTPDRPIQVEDADLVYHYAHGSGVMSEPDEDGKVTVLFSDLGDNHDGIRFDATVDDAEGAPVVSVAAQVLTFDEDDPLPPPVEFLQQVSLDNQALAEAAGGAIELSTIHAAKGREWDHVAIIGLVDGLFPAGFSDEGLVNPTEEERRVMFVAESRARRSLLMTTYRMQKLRQGGYMHRKPSLFLYELEESGKCQFSRRLPRKPAGGRPHWGAGRIGSW